MRLASQSTFIDENNELWIPASEYNILCHIDKNGKTEVIGSFKDYQVKNGWIISKVLKYKNKLYFFSSLGPDYWVLNLDKKELAHHVYTTDLSFSAISFIQMDDFIYIIPRFGKDSILKLNFDSFVSEIVSEPVFDENEQIHTHAFLYEEKIYFASRTENQISIFEYNTKTKAIKSNELHDLRFIKSVVSKADGIFVLGRNKNAESVILQIDSDDLDIKKIFYYDDTIPLNDDIIMFHVFNIKEKLLFISTNENSGFVFEKNSNDEYKINVVKGSKHYDVNNFSSQIVDEKIYFSSIKNEFFWCYDVENLEDYLVDYELDESELINKILNSERFENVFKECKYFKLETFIRCMESFKSREQKANNIGEKIYTKLKWRA
ncbi:MAG: hypothetical protein E7522_00830 [Ruminococcaceae bacterium]|nr:hypothetical protein [Oscillospiraceae bacterium]